MTQSLISGDAAFAIVLAAWWQLRRSAHLLPHLRQGPSSYFFHPGHAFFARILLIITLRLPLTIWRGWWWPQRRPGPLSQSGPTPMTEPTTCPFPVVEARSPGPATVPIGRPVVPLNGETGPGSVEPPTQPTPLRRGAR
jgi:hypothetical protein